MPRILLITIITGAPSGNMPAMIARRRSGPLARSSTGSFSLRAMTMLVPSMAKYMMKPGTMPATNN